MRRLLKNKTFIIGFTTVILTIFSVSLGVMFYRSPNGCVKKHVEQYTCGTTFPVPRFYPCYKTVCDEWRAD